MTATANPRASKMGSLLAKAALPVICGTGDVVDDAVEVEVGVTVSLTMLWDVAVTETAWVITTVCPRDVISVIGTTTVATVVGASYVE